jgi:hypothetical protein
MEMRQDSSLQILLNGVPAWGYAAKSSVKKLQTYKIKFSELHMVGTDTHKL